VSENLRFKDDSLRLLNWDYSFPGFYFITMNTWDREPLFGKFVNGEFLGNNFSRILTDLWQGLTDYYENIHLDVFQVMPDHVHGIIEIKETDWNKIWEQLRINQTKPSPTIESSQQSDSNKIDQTKLKSRRGMLIPKIISQYKTTTAKQINILRNTPEKRIWQAGYTDRIIRNLEELDRTRRYIVNNPGNYQPRSV
jgi:REP element-mobilizing transposase RayT